MAAEGAEFVVEALGTEEEDEGTAGDEAETEEEEEELERLRSEGDAMTTNTGTSSLAVEAVGEGAADAVKDGGISAQRTKAKPVREQLQLTPITHACLPAGSGGAVPSEETNKQGRQLEGGEE